MKPLPALLAPLVIGAVILFIALGAASSLPMAASGRTPDWSRWRSSRRR